MPGSGHRKGSFYNGTTLAIPRRQVGEPKWRLRELKWRLREGEPRQCLIPGLDAQEEMPDLAVKSGSSATYRFR